MGEARRNAPVWATWLLVIIGLLLLTVAGVYFTVPAKSLPSFFPGYRAAVSRHHNGHAILLTGLAVVAFVGAWQTTGYRVPRPTDT